MFKEVKRTLENSAINPGNKLVIAKKKRFPNFYLVPESEIMRESSEREREQLVLPTMPFLSCNLE